MGPRIGSPVWWNRIVLKDGINEWRRGIMLAWGTDYEEFRDGIGLYPVGVVEDGATARVHSVPCHLLCFASDSPVVK